MSKIYFLSVKNFKEEHPIHGNVDVQLLKPSLWRAQEINIQEAIGSKLYDQLEEQIKTSTLTADNTTLLNNYINHALGYYTLSEIIRPMTMQLTNKGLASKDDQYQTSGNLKEIESMEAFYRTRAEWFAQRLIDFLKANVKLYPKYAESGDCDDIKPIDNAYTTNIYFPK